MLGWTEWKINQNEIPNFIEWKIDRNCHFFSLWGLHASRWSGRAVTRTRNRKIFTSTDLSMNPESESKCSKRHMHIQQQQQCRQLKTQAQQAHSMTISNKSHLSFSETMFSVCCHGTQFVSFTHNIYWPSLCVSLLRQRNFSTWMRRTMVYVRTHARTHSHISPIRICWIQIHTYCLSHSVCARWMWPA